MKPEELDRMLRDDDQDKDAMALPRDNENNPDPNANVARIVGETIEATGSDNGGGNDDPTIKPAVGQG